MAVKRSNMDKLETLIKRKHCKVIRANEDLILFFKEGFYGAVGTPNNADEIKWFNDNSYGIVLNTRNFDKVKEELNETLNW